MKTLQCIIFIILLSPLIAFSKGFTIKGNITGLQSGMVSLAYVNADGEDTTLFAPIKAGNFTLAGSAQEPQLARLTVTEGWSYSKEFYLENSAIEIQVAKNDAEKTIITGSANNVVFEKLKPGLDDFFEHARQNKTAHAMAASTHNLQALQTADSIWNMQQARFINNIRNTITANANNYAALHFIRWLLFKPDNYDAIFALFTQLSKEVRTSEASKKLLSDFEHLHRTMPGQPAPEISGKDTSGKAVTLAAFKGKVILLDFWASYCGPCRQENRNMIPVYQKYHAAGFEMVSLSLDNERSLWLQAMHTDGLIWPQVSELRGGASATAGIYDITDLPRNVLIDKTGKIYAKDLHGEDLVNAIALLLKQ